VDRRLDLENVLFSFSSIFLFFFSFLLLRGPAAGAPPVGLGESEEEGAGGRCGQGRRRGGGRGREGRGGEGARGGEEGRGGRELKEILVLFSSSSFFFFFSASSHSLFL